MIRITNLVKRYDGSAVLDVARLRHFAHVRLEPLPREREKARHEGKHAGRKTIGGRFVKHVEKEIGKRGLLGVVIQTEEGKEPDYDGLKAFLAEV